MQDVFAETWVVVLYLIGCFSLSWHLLHVTMVAFIAFIVTGSFKIATILASAEFLWESFAYFIHERIWNKITWGTI